MYLQDKKSIVGTQIKTFSPETLTYIVQ